MEIPRTDGVEPTPTEQHTPAIKEGYEKHIDEVTAFNPEIIQHGLMGGYEEVDVYTEKERAEMPTCLKEYGEHRWVKHEETLVEYCPDCFIRRDVWENPEKGVAALNNTTEMLDKVPPQLRDHVIKPGEVRNPNGRPKGSRNLTTIVMEALRRKTYTLEDKATGKKIEISGEEAFAEAVLEVAVKNKDREGLRMIWEFSDGKPTQQHKIDLGPVRGYEIPEAEEDKLKEEFSMVFNAPSVVALEPAPIEAKPAQNEELTPKPDETTSTPA